MVSKKIPQAKFRAVADRSYSRYSSSRRIEPSFDFSLARTLLGVPIFAKTMLLDVPTDSLLNRFSDLVAVPITPQPFKISEANRSAITRFIVTP